MKKIDLEKLIADFIKAHEFLIEKYRNEVFEHHEGYIVFPPPSNAALKVALEEQGLEYKDGAIVAIEKPKTIKFEPELSEFEDRLGEIVISTWDIAKECEECKGDVEDVKKWAKELLDIAHRQFSKEEANNMSK